MFQLKLRCAEASLSIKLWRICMSQFPIKIWDKELGFQSNYYAPGQFVNQNYSGYRSVVMQMDQIAEKKFTN